MSVQRALSSNNGMLRVAMCHVDGYVTNMCGVILTWAKLCRKLATLNDLKWSKFSLKILIVKEKSLYALFLLGIFFSLLLFYNVF